jgi:phosphatidylcholine synthase
MPGWAAAVLVLTCVALTFVPLRWAHPMRTPLMWPVTLALTAAWCVAAVITLWSGFPAGGASKAVLLIAAAYGVGLALARSRAA